MEKLKKEAGSPKRKYEKVDNQKYNKVFTEEELKNKGGIVAPGKIYFIAILQLYFLEHCYHKYKNDLNGLAQFLDNSNSLFIKAHGKYKLMKISSILTYLHQYSVEAFKDLKEKNKEEEKYKSKK